MLTRRRFIEASLTGLAVAQLPLAFRAHAADAQPSFADLLARARQNQAALLATNAEREGWAHEYDYFATKAVAPRVKPSARAISKNALDLIVAFEVSDQRTYTSRYQRATWPSGDSGITIGIGYDLGYVTQAWLQDDWKGFIDPAVAASFQGACGVHGAPAKARLAEFRTPLVPWQAAYDQFTKNLAPRYTGETLKVLPQASALSDDSLGALVSLVYNRGASFNADGDRYREMRKIRALMTSGDLDQIPGQITSMKRLWEGKPNLAGLLTRRDLEAALFRQGLTPA